MRRHEQVVQELREVREKLFNLAKQHDQEGHNGEFCRLERVNMIAYLCHCLGLRPGMDLKILLDLWDEYDLNCLDRTCPHEGVRATTLGKIGP